MKITRTLTSTTVKAYFFDLATNKMGTEEITASGDNLEQIEKRIKKALDKEQKVYCKSEIVASVPMVWEVEESVFLANAEEVTKRNSAVKMVTRSVSMYIHNVTAFDKNTNTLQEVRIVADTDKAKEVQKVFSKMEQYKDLVYCTSTHVDTKTGVYGMTEDKFLSLAKPCTTRTIEE